MKKSSTPVSTTEKHNPIAKDLRTPKYKERVVHPKKYETEDFKESDLRDIPEDDWDTI